MDRKQLRTLLLDVLEQETWERPETLTDGVKLREELNLDSVDLLSVTLRIERQLGISLDSQDFERVVTVGQLLKLIEAKLAAKVASDSASKAA